MIWMQGTLFDYGDFSLPGTPESVAEDDSTGQEDPDNKLDYWWPV